VDVWIDIDNPPQVQYLLPLKAAFESAGARILVTARDHTITQELLRARNVEFHSVGTAFGPRKIEKVKGLLDRSRQLLSLVKDVGRPQLLLAASRSAPLVARRLRIPSFNITDYEFVNLTVFRLTRTYILHPEVIPAEAFLRRGIRKDRLIPFSGVKEDITFSTVDTTNGSVHDFGIGDGLTRVLFRPPAEQSHYYNRDSTALALALLEYLARREDVVVVFTPRYASQTAYLHRYAWKNEPVDLRRPVPFLELLKAVDAVVSSGGTMVREAAYLGIPAYSILRSRLGSVDRYLESLGRLGLVAAPRDFDRMTLQRGFRRPPMSPKPELLRGLVALMLERSRGG
jgi:uncharacterized protein